MPLSPLVPRGPREKISGGCNKMRLAAMSVDRSRGGGDSATASVAAGNAIEVAAGVVFRDGQVLITQRRPGDHLGGLWEFPGGKREPGETFEVCLQRELKEELGIEVDVGEWLDSVTHAYPEKTVHLR